MRCTGCIRNGCKIAIEDLGKLKINTESCPVWKREVSVATKKVISCLQPFNPLSRESPALRVMSMQRREQHTDVRIDSDTDGNDCATSDSGISSCSPRVRRRISGRTKVQKTIKLEEDHGHGRRDCSSCGNCHHTPITTATPSASSTAPVYKVMLDNPVEVDEPTFYMRELPSQLIGFSSQKGQRLLMECIQQSAHVPYFQLSEQFVTQESPPSCGLATLAMVLNSMQIDPKKVWRHPWRWFTEEQLESCLNKGMDWGQKGMTLEEVAYVAECQKLHTSLFYAEDSLSLAAFREVLRRYVSKPTEANSNVRIVTNFSRARLGQTGTGHYSPIGAYHEGKDKVLILDVARFKYPPYWVNVTDLWEAMRVPDPDAIGLGQKPRPRGFLVLEKIRECEDPCTVKLRSPSMENVQEAMAYVSQQKHAHCVARSYSHRLRHSLIHEPTKMDNLFDFARQTDIYKEVSDENPQDSLWRGHSALRKELWSLFLIALSKRHLPQAVQDIQSDIVATTELKSLNALCGSPPKIHSMCNTFSI